MNICIADDDLNVTEDDIASAIVQRSQEEAQVLRSQAVAEAKGRMEEAQAAIDVAVRECDAACLQYVRAELQVHLLKEVAL